MQRQPDAPSDLPHFGPDGCLAWSVKPADMKSRPAILVRMIRALMESPDNPTLFASGAMGIAEGETVLRAAGFTLRQIIDHGEYARQGFARFRRRLAASPFDLKDVALRIAAKVAQAQRRKGKWDLADIMIFDEPTIAFCLVEVLTLVMLAGPREARA